MLHQEMDEMGVFPSFTPHYSIDHDIENLGERRRKACAKAWFCCGVQEY